VIEAAHAAPPGPKWFDGRRSRPHECAHRQRVGGHQACRRWSESVRPAPPTRRSSCRPTTTFDQGVRDTRDGPAPPSGCCHSTPSCGSDDPETADGRTRPRHGRGTHRAAGAVQLLGRPPPLALRGGARPSASTVLLRKWRRSRPSHPLSLRACPAGFAVLVVSQAVSATEPAVGGALILAAAGGERPRATPPAVVRGRQSQSLYRSGRGTSTACTGATRASRTARRLSRHRRLAPARLLGRGRHARWRGWWHASEVA